MALDPLGRDPLNRSVVAPDGSHTCREISLSLNTASGTTPAIYFAGMAKGIIIIPLDEAMVTLTFYVAEKLGGTYVPLRTAAGVVVTQTVAHTNAYPLPAELQGATAVKITANVAGPVFLTLSE